MPFKSEKQRRWMHTNEPAMAEKWENETSTKDKPMSKTKSYNKKLDYALGARGGKRSGLKKKTSAAGRRKESEGGRKAAGKRKYKFTSKK